MNDGRKVYTFLWFIENYSYCWHKNGDGLVSSEFTVDDLEDTLWTLQVYPRGHNEKTRGSICLFLVRNKHDDGPEQLPLKYELSVLAADGSALISEGCELRCDKGDGYGFLQHPQIDEVLLRRKADYLPQDTLSVRCRIWIGEDDTNTVIQYSARTRIGVEKISFLQKVENFADLKPNEKKTIQVRSHSKTGYCVSSTLYFTDGEGQVRVEIVPSSINYKLSIQKLSLLDRLRKVIECGEVDNRYDATTEDIEKLTLSLTRREILRRKREYLPNDELTLICECTFSTGVDFEKIEETRQLPIEAIKKDCNNECKNNGNYAAEKLSACRSVQVDLNTIYNNRHLTDVVLKTKTKSFPAHKLVLCARSSVFNEILTNTDCIQIQDLEDDTVQQFLLFLYSDQLENLQWESAIKLYHTAVEYAVEKLKLLCSSFLADNVTTSSAVELLRVAYTRNDSDFVYFVNNFIVEHEREVFGSDEWENREGPDSSMYLNIMKMKYERIKRRRMNGDLNSPTTFDIFFKRDFYRIV